MNQSEQSDYDVIIAGGGLAGLISALELAEAHFSVLVVEKGSYPRHKVCGEYISREVVPYLKKLKIYPAELQPVSINRFVMSSADGSAASCRMGMGGFGLSRYTFDHFLYQKAQDRGVAILCNKEMDRMEYIDEDYFEVELKSGEKFTTRVGIGAFGKRSRLDHNLNRSSASSRSSYLAVKQHFRTKFPTDTVALHNFSGGYCGLSTVENKKVNMCYLTRKEIFNKYGDTESFKIDHLSQNPHLRKFFQKAVPEMEKPMVISQLNFDRKDLVEDHILMTGDAAALIHPLCGNGMAMAIHSAKICASQVKLFLNERISRSDMEWNYRIEWEHQFATRLRFGQGVQNLFGRNTLSSMAVHTARLLPYLLKKAVRFSHGRIIRV